MSAVRRAKVRRDNARDALGRRNYKAVCTVLDNPPRKPHLTNGQVRRFVRRELSNGVPA